MTEHTPGPWRISGKWEFITGGRDDQGVCYMNGMPYPSEKPGPAMRANARLIAAAPELLAALEKIKEDVTYQWPNVVVQLLRINEIARAAILKATQGAPKGQSDAHSDDEEGDMCLDGERNRVPFEDCGGPLDICSDGEIRCDAHADSFQYNQGAPE